MNGKITINNNQLLNDSGLSFETLQDSIFYILNSLEFFGYNNLTKQQKQKIDDVKNILKNINFD